MGDNYEEKIRERRDYQFYDDELNEEVWTNIMMYSCTRGSFKEVCKAFREVCYDQVSYYGEDNCSPIYKDEEKYPREVIDQLTYLQRKISTAVDLYEQGLVNGRKFDWDYLVSRLGV
ncbi:MAG: hypothetical protein J6T15_04915 [Bacilli bacterium]|nr:hypothetical protein [Bacilli bacterium]